MRNDRSLLIIMTIFAALFVVTFIFYRSVSKENEALKNELQAFKYLYDGNIEKFVEYMKKLGKKDTDINFYIEKAVEIQIGKAEIEMEKHNYDIAYHILLDAYNYSQNEKQKYYIAYLLGKVLNKKEEYEEAYNFLKIFLSGKSYNFSKEALLELALSAKKLGKPKELKIIEEYFKKDPIYYRKFQEVIK